MIRREFLKLGAAGATSAALPLFMQDAARADKPTVIDAGWRPQPNYKQPRRSFGSYARSFGSLGTGEGQVVLLYKFLEKTNLLAARPHRQTIGDCVGHGFAMGVDLLTAVQIEGFHLAESFPGPAAVEVIYAGSKNEIAFQKHGITALLRGDGSFGGYAAEFLNDYGSVPRAKYSIDLSTYSGYRGRELTLNGLPQDIKILARKHPVRTAARVTSYKEARDAIANGYPVPVCSGIGFDPNKGANQGGRDSQGFLHPADTWYHCMVLTAVDDNSSRPGLLCQNSWGTDWVDGPKRHGQPDGSFWVDADVVDAMLGEGDSYAISNYVGFPRQVFKYDF